ncbi:hypothetical protein GWK48_03080 [Metallosphaera tengchongensis]|uniref:A-type ATP synthase subunit E n=1 Tax=Metallosphaera tengchongensis TaxID=1532350 RepID=A0A6N0NS20_9CREN|nr:V-type ATP synthase subunit E [Metallosphaera tengchongensis]QKQ99511.1 hypothetical protein GWK48_03080 [Metallosphaera tengchongensis]
MVSIEELMEQVAQSEIEVIKAELSKALQESLRVVQDRYEQAVTTYTSKINEMVSQAKEEVEGERAKLDIESKRAILSEKNYWLNVVYERTLKSLNKVKNSDKYVKGLEEVLKREARENSVIFCSPDEEEVVRKLVKNLKLKVEVKVEQRMIGGVKVQYSDVGLVRDYSLNLILDQVFESLKPRIAEILFGEM